MTQDTLNKFDYSKKEADEPLLSLGDWKATKF